MEIQEFVEPQRIRKWGEQIIAISFPAKIKVQTTGPNAQVIVDIGPEQGETWKLLIRVEASVE